MSDIRDLKNALATKGSDITPILVRLPLEMIEGLERAAKRRDISRNAFVRKALHRVLDGEPDVGS